MSRASTLNAAIASLTLYCLSSGPVKSQEGDGTLAGIRAHNMASVLQIHSVLKSADGTATLFDDSGTGFIVSSDGYVLTANHVIPVRTPNSVLTIEGHLASAPAITYRLEYIHKDEDFDLALIRLPDPGADHWIPVDLGDASTVPDTATLYALGFAANTFVPSQGILRNRYAPGGKWLTSLNINHGDSGGPVFDIQGRVVAISAGGFDAANALTVVTPENLAQGLLKLAAVSRPATLPSASPAPGAPVNQTFNFYQSVDSETTTPREIKQRYCLPAGYSIQNSTSRITTQNGPSHLESVKTAPDSKNCVDLSASLAGQGVDRIGPVIVNHKGNGWLGVEITVAGTKN
jgi:hypothetical protein